MGDSGPGDSGRDGNPVWAGAGRRRPAAHGRGAVRFHRALAGVPGAFSDPGGAVRPAGDLGVAGRARGGEWIGQRITWCNPVNLRRLLPGNQFNLKQLWPEFSGDEQTLVRFIVGDAIKHGVS